LYTQGGLVVLRFLVRLWVRYRFGYIFNSRISRESQADFFKLAAALVLAFFAFSVAGYAQAAGSSAAGRAALPDAPGASGKISGTVLDTNGDIIEGARVALAGKDGSHEQVVVTRGDGQFNFSGLTPGIFKLTVTGPGMGTYASPEIKVDGGEFRIVSGVVLPVAEATSSVTVSGDREAIAEEEVHVEIQQRVLGVLPNFYTSYDWNAGPLGKKQKFELAYHAMTDPVAFAGAGVLAAYEHLNQVYPAYEYGFEGYNHRFWAEYGNDAISRMITSAALPSLFHQDPRYFYKGTGSVRQRAQYAIVSVVVCRGDNGKRQLNISRLLGTFAAGAVSNLYYPPANRGASLVLTTGLIQTAGNIGNNLMREFLFKRISNQAKNGGN
jgi:hypothetical protein